MRASLKRSSLAAAALLLALPACEALQPEFKKPNATQLKGTEISSLLTGRSISLSNARGRSYTNVFGRDGRVMISGGKGNLYGDWKVTGDRYCLILDEDKQEQCMAIYSIGDGTYQMVNADGTLRNTFKVQ